jgi:hypothetical protein
MPRAARADRRHVPRSRDAETRFGLPTFTASIGSTGRVAPRRGQFAREATRPRDARVRASCSGSPPVAPVDDGRRRINLVATGAPTRLSPIPAAGTGPRDRRTVARALALPRIRRARRPRSRRGVPPRNGPGSASSTGRTGVRSVPRPRGTPRRSQAEGGGVTRAHAPVSPGSRGSVHSGTRPTATSRPSSTTGGRGPTARPSTFPTPPEGSP